MSGEPGWDRTIDHLINVPPRLSSPLASLQSGLSLHRSFRFRWVPSSLYTFLSPGLARDCRRHHADEFPEFDTIPSAVSPPMAPTKSSALPLSYRPLVLLCNTFQSVTSVYPVEKSATPFLTAAQRLL